MYLSFLEHFPPLAYLLMSGLSDDGTSDRVSMKPRVSFRFVIPGVVNLQRS